MNHDADEEGDQFRKGYCVRCNAGVAQDRATLSARISNGDYLRQNESASLLNPLQPRTTSNLRYCA